MYIGTFLSPSYLCTCSPNDTQDWIIEPIQKLPILETLALTIRDGRYYPGPKLPLLSQRACAEHVFDRIPSLCKVGLSWVDMGWEGTEIYRGGVEV